MLVGSRHNNCIRVELLQLATALFHRAGELVALIEGRSLSPRILELRGRLAAALGETAASKQILREALDLYREIGAIGHAERLGREIAA